MDGNTALSLEPDRVRQLAPGRSLPSFPNTEHRTPSTRRDGHVLNRGLILRSRQTAFTLIELVLVMALLVTVLTVSYRVVVDCIDTDRRIDKIAQPEKVGEGLMALIRRDLCGTYFRQFGRRIFSVVDGGVVPDALDELSFLTTVKPTPSEIGDDERASEVFEMDLIMGVRYFLQENPDIKDVHAYSLYRKEMIDLDPNFPLESPGLAYELHDKLAFLSVECFDGITWSVDWDSEARIEYEEEELALMNAEDSGIARVSAGTSAATVRQAPGVSPEMEPTSLPPAAVPAAVRVEFGFYSGRGNQIELDREGQPILRTFSATIPLIAAQRQKMEFDDTDALGGEGLSGEAEGARGGAAGTPGGAAGTPGGRSTEGRSTGGRGGGRGAGGARSGRGSLGAGSRLGNR